MLPWPFTEYGIDPFHLKTSASFHLHQKDNLLRCLFRQLLSIFLFLLQRKAPPGLTNLKGFWFQEIKMRSTYSRWTQKFLPCQFRKMESELFWKQSLVVFGLSKRARNKLTSRKRSKSHRACLTHSYSWLDRKSSNGGLQLVRNRGSQACLWLEEKSSQSQCPVSGS